MKKPEILAPLKALQLPLMPAVTQYILVAVPLVLVPMLKTPLMTHFTKLLKPVPLEG